MLVPVLHYVAGHGRADTGDVCEKVPGSRIEVDTDTVHAVLHHLVQTLLQQPLVHIVLILAHTYRLGVYLHQLGQRVHDAPSDRYGSAHSHIVLRELLPADRRGRIYRRTVLAHRVHADALRQGYLLDKGLGLTAGCAVTDSDMVRSLRGG